mmetsp:Transcript_25854/g.64741  ORF Transcript_25854/g.64741 Transcript_25854/m.64741 type:complete len:350 (+) Transcript_25854:480-1529(+)
MFRYVTRFTALSLSLALSFPFYRERCYCVPDSIACHTCILTSSPSREHLTLSCLGEEPRFSRLTAPQPIQSSEDVILKRHLVLPRLLPLHVQLGNLVDGHQNPPPLPLRLLGHDPRLHLLQHHGLALHHALRHLQLGVLPRMQLPVLHLREIRFVVLGALLPLCLEKLGHQLEFYGLRDSQTRVELIELSGVRQPEPPFESFLLSGTLLAPRRVRARHVDVLLVTVPMHHEHVQLVGHGAKRGAERCLDGGARPPQRLQTAHHLVARRHLLQELPDVIGAIAELPAVAPQPHARLDEGECALHALEACAGAVPAPVLLHHAGGACLVDVDLVHGADDQHLAPRVLQPRM